MIYNAFQEAFNFLLTIKCLPESINLILFNGNATYHVSVSIYLTKLQLGIQALSNSSLSELLYILLYISLHSPI